MEDLRGRGDQALMPFQLEGVRFGLANGGRVLLGDEMGLGKTVQALVLAVHYVKDWPLLIVCPASLCQQWCDEASAWLPEAAAGPGQASVQVLSRGCEVQRRLARVFIISYDLLARTPKFQALPDGRRFRAIICDEAHYLKSPDSQRTQSIGPLVRAARRAILLTGTPALNNAAELYSIIDMLLPGLVPSKEEFLQRYAEPHELRGPRGRRVTLWRGSRRPEELCLLLRSTVMVRRLKAEVLEQLPAKRRQCVRFAKAQLDAAVLKEMDQLRHEVATGVAAGKGIKAPRTCAEDLCEDAAASGEVAGAAAAPATLASLVEAGGSAEAAPDEPCDDLAGNSAGGGNGRKVTGPQQLTVQLALLTSKAKQAAVCAYVEYLVLAGCRLLLFAHHRSTMDYLEEQLKKLRAHHIRIDGSVAQPERTARVEHFQKDSGVQVALLSITACGQGLNLQSASTVVFAELYWVVGQMVQAEDRVHRVGQTAISVNIHYLVAAGTLDEAMYEALNRKHRDTSATLDGERRTLGAEYVAAGGRGAFARPAAETAQAQQSDDEVGGCDSKVEAAN